MRLSVNIEIKAPKEKVWQVITDIENSTDTISGIDKIEILDKPKETIVGLKWKETRTIFGKSSTETMWITEAEENKYYQTRAESNGSVYQTVLKLSEQGKATNLSMEFSSEAVSVTGKIMALVFNAMLKKSMKKLIEKDLLDIKTFIENK